MSSLGHNVQALPTQLEHLAGKIRSAYERCARGRQEWIEGTLELAAALWDARQLFSHPQPFNDWLIENDLQHLKKDARAALINIGKHPGLAREALTKTKSTSWDCIWRLEMRPHVPAPVRPVRSAPNSSQKTAPDPTPPPAPPKRKRAPPSEEIVVPYIGGVPMPPPEELLPDHLWNEPHPDYPGMTRGLVHTREHGYVHLPGARQRRADENVRQLIACVRDLGKHCKAFLATAPKVDLDAFLAIYNAYEAKAPSIHLNQYRTEIEATVALLRPLLDATKPAP